MPHRLIITTLTALGLAALCLAGCDVDAPHLAPPASPAVVSAPAAACAVPTDLRPAPAYRPPRDEIVDDEPTAYHLLAISWSPQACRTGRDYPDARHQCRDNQFGLTLHGLWPNGADRRHPRYCDARPGSISEDTVRRSFCMIPSPSLMQHEWAAHGTCGWDGADAYFAQAADMWNDLVKPDLEAIRTDRLRAGDIRDAFIAANPGMPRRAIMVILSDGWLREVRLCYSRDFRIMPCPRGVGAPDHEGIRLAPTGPGQSSIQAGAAATSH